MTDLDYCLTLRAAIEDCLEAFGLTAVSSTKDERPGFTALGSLFEDRTGSRQVVVTVSCEDEAPAPSGSGQGGGAGPTPRAPRRARGAADGARATRQRPDRWGTAEAAEAEGEGGGSLMELSDQDIEEETAVSNELLVKLLEEADETGEDMGAVCYSLWVNLTRILAEGGLDHGSARQGSPALRRAPAGGGSSLMTEP